MTDQERLEEIKHMYGLIEAEQFTIKTADYEWLYAAAEKSIEIEKYVLEMSGKLDGLHEYLRKNHYGKGSGKHIVDVAIQVMEEQQKEIERLNKSVEKEMHTGYSLEGQIHDVKEKLESENKHYRQLLLGVLKLKHVDEMFKRQISEALKE